jgi:hypothetical protein
LQLLQCCTRLVKCNNNTQGLSYNPVYCCIPVKLRWLPSAPCNYFPDSRWSKWKPKRQRDWANPVCRQRTKFCNFSVTDPSAGTTSRAVVLSFTFKVGGAFTFSENTTFVVDTDTLSWGGVFTSRGGELPLFGATQVFALLSPASKGGRCAVKAGVRFDPYKIKQNPVYTYFSHSKPFLKYNTQIVPQLRVVSAPQHNVRAFK